MNQNSEKKRRGVWQDLVAVDPHNNVLTLQAKSRKVYEFRPKEWHARLSISDLAKLVERGEKVRVMVDFENYAVKGAYHEAKVLEKKTPQLRKEKEVEPQKILFELGNKPVFDIEDKAWIKLEKGEKGWGYEIRLWAVKPVESEDPHKVIKEIYYVPVPVTLKSEKALELRENALQEAVSRAYEHIVAEVLGRSFIGEHPAEDELSLEGRKWLRKLDAITRKYLNKRLKIDVPAGVRLIKKIPLKTGVLMLTEDEHVGFLTGAKPENVEFLRRRIKGGPITFNVYFDEERPFVKVGNGIYNAYYIASIFEQITGKKMLNRDGKFVEGLKGKSMVVEAIETQGDYLIVPVGSKGYFVLGASRGVDMKYVQVPEIHSERSEEEIENE